MRAATYASALTSNVHASIRVTPSAAFVGRQAGQLGRVGWIRLTRAAQYASSTPEDRFFSQAMVIACVGHVARGGLVEASSRAGPAAARVCQALGKSRTQHIEHTILYFGGVCRTSFLLRGVSMSA